MSDEHGDALEQQRARAPFRADRRAGGGRRGLLMEPKRRVSVVDYYTDVVLPALAERLDTAFPEFGWRRDARGWIATNDEMTHRVLGVRAQRVVAHGAAPRGFLIHGGDPVLWTAYVNGGTVPRGAEFVRAVTDLAARVGVDASAFSEPRVRDRRADLLEAVFTLAQRELASARGNRARAYLEGRMLPPAALGNARLGVVPPRAAARSALLEQGFEPN